MKAFSNNIVYVDTEFTDLNPYTGEILSVGMVKPNGEEFYVEIAYEGEIHPWVRTNILPTLTGENISRDEAKKKIADFLGAGKPHMVAFVPQYDMVYMVKLFGTESLPFHWMPIDFASMLFGDGQDPGQMRSERRGVLMHYLGLDGNDYPEHHALSDARALKDVWAAMVQ
ncbi:hypothetical protein COV06_02025 [Candidatus Uhrbacteria bacterium CG10_big_fil_rev_8_21_14_0_10_50_16]|uniref:Uncharacterized protein n=1 Tax=Candidatus Uhrbacteria bacterium CG10_big_fil_rev_8_21_14_0_10_50_16 TaxID=1975039 RepID=A0A2H0RMH3_9BACT|nr:MAG: hypothetical protein COV06_02025 [Candidatus Uhrbacteria bacterium CG10_big_fil_rev_8_21_14_0_10_50_16]